VAASKKNKKAAREPRLLSRLARYAWGPGRPLLLVCAAIAALAVAWYAIWQRVGPTVLASETYHVTPDEVDMTPPPEWIHSDLRAEVFRSASFERSLKLTDEDLTERIAGAFALHPWVAWVRRVEKRHPARVVVELEYRRPVCMIEVLGELLPVDAGAVLLPKEDFSPVEAARYPRLVGVKTPPVGAVGERWNDARVLGGAAIAQVLGDVWEEMNLAVIVPSEPPIPGVATELTFTLITRLGTRIFWGRAPGRDGPGEIAADEKLARLETYYRRYGTLEGSGGPQELDIYQLRLGARPGRRAE
jgi:hypothetical protein